MAELVTIDGFPLTGTTRDGDWKLTDNMPGWWDRPEPKSKGVSRTIADGSFKTPIDYENRLITINGRVKSSNHDYLHQAAGIITSLGFRGGAKLLVDGHGPAQWATVDPRGSATCEFETDTYLRFQIPLEAIDPFKYGEARSFSAAVGEGFDVYQRGTVPAIPTVTVTGSFPGGYELTLGGRLVTVERAVTSGSPHVVDMRTGILRVGGSVDRGGIVYSELFKIAPGMPQNFYTVARTSGTGTVKVAFNDTYI